MPGNESYYDRGSMDIDDIDYAANPDSSIGGVMKKKAMEHKGKEKSEDGFVPVSDEYGNELCVYAKDFPELMKEARGSEVMFVVRGAVKGVMGEGDRAKLTCFIWDTALIHGACGPKKDNK